MSYKQTLYHHTHNITGKKYLGQTTRDLSTYKGSSVNWLEHLEQYGDDYTTEILFESDNVEEFKLVCKYYSEKFNVVDNPEYFNLVMEYGGNLGGKANPNYKDGKWIGRHIDKELERRVQKECDAVKYERDKDVFTKYQMNARYRKRVRDRVKAEYWFNLWKEGIRGTDPNGKSLQKTDTFEFWYNCKGSMSWDKRRVFYANDNI